MAVADGVSGAHAHPAKESNRVGPPAPNCATPITQQPNLHPNYSPTRAHFLRFCLSMFSKARQVVKCSTSLGKDCTFFVRHFF
jgi:hypothetical protein